MAEALPVSTSMRSTMPSGMLEMSVALTPPSIGRGKSARRRPLTSTRVWFGPRPRRSTCCAPGVKSELLIDCGLWVAPLFWVMDLITSGMLVKPLALICSAVITLIGEGPSICAHGMREPVTCTACSSVVSGSAGAGGGGGRSEEHTSDLQSLMRPSYAVFCLKTTTLNEKKTTKYHAK